MKQLLAVAAACVAFPCEPLVAAEPPQAFSWSGAYLGAFVGGAGGAAMNTTEPVRLDNGAFWYRPFHSPYSYSLEPSFIGGLTAGFNLQIPQTSFVVGIEGEYSYLGVTGGGRDVNQFYYSALINNFAPNVSLHRTSIGSDYGYGLIGGRIGYGVDRFLLYVKGGAVFTNIATEFRAYKDEDNIFPLPNLHLLSSAHKTGYAVGGGVEYAFAAPSFQNVSLKVEYLYLGVDNAQTAFGFCTCGFHWAARDSVSGLHTAKVGLNYRFNQLPF